MDPKILEQIGLTKGESKVYLALLKLGQTKTGLLSIEAKVSSSKVYKILDRLIKKGLAGFVTKGKTKYYSAMKPQRIIEYLENEEKELVDKKEMIKKFLPELEKQENFEKTNAVIYDGFKAVTNLFRNIIDELNKNEEYFVLGATYNNIEGLREFFYNHHKRRYEKGIKLKMLANYEIKNKLEPTTKKLSEIKYLPKYIKTPMEIVFYKNKVIIVIWKESPTAFLLENKESVLSFKSYYEALWKISNK